jgi:ABC-type Na+ transport system ATPase subunit NatA
MSLRARRLAAKAPGRQGLAEDRSTEPVLVSNHAAADLEELASKVAVLKGGILVAFDTPAAIRAKAKSDRLEGAAVKLLGEGAQ